MFPSMTFKLKPKPFTPPCSLMWTKRGLYIGSKLSVNRQGNEYYRTTSNNQNKKVSQNRKQTHRKRAQNTEISLFKVKFWTINCSTNASEQGRPSPLSL